MERVDRSSYTFRPQEGKPGHCLLAEVFDPWGRSVLTVESTDDPEQATRIADICCTALTLESWRLAEPQSADGQTHERP